jgi:hypothetical protein
VPVRSPTFSPDDRQFFKIPLNADLQVGELYDIFISYAGVLNDEIAGFSRSEYRDENGNIEYVQFGFNFLSILYIKLTTMLFDCLII